MTKNSLLRLVSITHSAFGTALTSHLCIIECSNSQWLWFNGVHLGNLQTSIILTCSLLQSGPILLSIHSISMLAQCNIQWRDLTVNCHLQDLFAHTRKLSWINNRTTYLQEQQLVKYAFTHCRIKYSRQQYQLVITVYWVSRCLKIRSSSAVVMVALRNLRDKIPNGLSNQKCNSMEQSLESLRYLILRN